MSISILTIASLVDTPYYDAGATRHRAAAVAVITFASSMLEVAV